MRFQYYPGCRPKIKAIFYWKIKLEHNDYNLDVNNCTTECYPKQ